MTTVPLRLDALAEVARPSSGPTVSLTSRVSRPGLPTAAELVLGALLVVAVPALAPLQAAWVVQFLLLLALLVVPGLLLLRTLLVSGRPLLYLAVPASLVLLLAVGLAVNVIGPALGIEAPLRTGPLVVGLEIACVPLLAVLARRAARYGLAADEFALPSPTVLAPLLLPVLGLLGAQQLNDERGSAAAILAALVVLVVLVLLVVRVEHLGDGLLSMGLYGIAVTLLWSFSLRSESVYGYDVISEFRDMAQTVADGRWFFSHPSDAYGAMLSITVLPAGLHELTGLPVEAFPKVVFPAVFAVVPVLVYAICRRFVSRRWSFVGAVLVVVQSNFGQQFPGLAKQEIALVLFSALLLVAVYELPRRRTGLVLAALFAAGVVVCHYSTAYTAVFLTGAGGIILGVAVAITRRAARGLGPILVAFVALVVGVVVWNGVLTQSTENVREVVEQFRTEGFSVLPNRGPNALETYFAGNVTTNLDARDYQDLVVQQFLENRPYVVPLPNGAAPQYALTDVPTVEPPPWLVGAFAVAVVVRQLVFLSAVVATAVLLLRRRASATRRIVGSLMGAALLALIGVRLSGTLASSYNQDRALLQALIVLVIGVSWLLGRIAARPRVSGRALTGVVTFTLALLMALSTSLVGLPAGLGTLNLTSNSEDFKRFYVYRAETASAEWLNSQTTRANIIYADRYGGLRYLLVSGRVEGVLPEIVPAVIDREAWIYATATNQRDGSARSQTEGRFGTYGFPERFLIENFDRVYANDYSSVYHRSGSR